MSDALIVVGIGAADMVIVWVLVARGEPGVGVADSSFKMAVGIESANFSFWRCVVY